MKQRRLVLRRLQFPNEQAMRQPNKTRNPDAQAAAKPHDDAPARHIYAVAGVIVVACALAYGNSFVVPLIFDDEESILNNPTIKRLWPPWGMLIPPGNGEAVQRRPVVNVSLAINYAISGEKVWSYHALNLAAHISAALLLFGIVRRTLSGPTCRRPLNESDPAPLAAAVALLWAVHPLLTEAVTYIIQRTEVLAGLFFLLTLYCVIRGSSSPRAIVWQAAAVLSCALAVGSKESAISAPVVVILYDRVFLCPSWREIFRRRWALYVGLAASWIIVLLMLPHGSEGTAIFGRRGQGFAYLLSQGGAIVHYLRLCFWPHPLVLDYGNLVPQPIAQQLPSVLLVVALLIVVGISFRYRPWLGFLGVCFFAILAPSSSIIPLPQQVAAEKRMYLPLAAVTTAVVLGGYFAQQWLVRRKILSPSVAKMTAVSLATIVVVVFGVLTYQRNSVYRNTVSIWEDVVAKMPDNARAHNNLGKALSMCERHVETVDHFRKALEIDPGFAEAHNNLGLALAHRNQFDETLVHYRKAIAIRPTYANAYNNLGKALADCGRFAEAVVPYEQVLKIKPDSADAHLNLGIALVGAGRIDDAIDHYKRALEINPNFAEAHNNLGLALAGRGRISEAMDNYREAMKVNLTYADAYYNLGNLQLQQGKPAEAIANYQKAIEIRPAYAEAYINLGAALAETGQYDAAIVQFQKALEIQPQSIKARRNLESVWALRESLQKTPPTSPPSPPSH
jgi:protein O-mannosyl-transferase